MTKEEAKQIEMPERERRRYFSTSLGKANLTKAPEDRSWFKIESVGLDNAFPFGDEVGVVTPWTFPTVDMPPITDEGLRLAYQKIRAGGPWRADQRSTTEPWVGIPIAQALGYDLSRPPYKKKIAETVADLIGQGVLVREQRHDGHRELRWYVTVAEDAPAATPASRPPVDEPSAAVAATAAGYDEAM